jgi:hypothetical protein
MNEIHITSDSGTHFAAENESVVYYTDREGRITAVNEGWRKFAAENNGEAVEGDSVLGTSVWACVVDISLRKIYQSLFERAVAGVPVSLTYRCDAPDRRRWWNMTMCCAANSRIKFESKLLREEKRPTVTLLEPGHRRSEWFVKICSWCQQVATESDGWLPVEDAVRVMAILEGEEFPQLSHGICPDCAKVMLAELDMLMKGRPKP